ncbi:MAG: radical SAM protein [Chloroflexi bacterium]|nr:radical SAM protein [Chloroflexota bacterium]MCL5108188.1 radical SAM protein [Chloroflexota bacterium]MDA8216530.1 radical SAM protein [Dehalococcoidales bacterium]
MSALRPVRVKEDIIYGPVNSRRLGRSLGVNVLGAAHKVCTFDCAYCQLRQPRGYALPSNSPQAPCHRQCVRCNLAYAATGVLPSRHQLPSADEVLGAVEKALAENDAVQSITLSGNGEPTLHPQFADIVTGLLALRDRLSPEAAVSVLSNSSTAGRPTVTRALRQLDLRIMKLDAGDEATFRQVNRPCPGVSLADVVEGLRALGSFTLQTLFVGGTQGNASPEQVENWLQAVKRLRPERLQIYSLDRVPAEGGLTQLTSEALATIALRASAVAGAEARIY